MKIQSLIPGVLIILFAFNFSAFGQQPSVKAIVKKNMRSLDPYQYDAYAIKDITYNKKAQSVVVEFAVFSEEEYKIVFCKTELPQELEINIYDKNPKSPTKKLIYFDESGKKDQYSCTFKPTSTGSYFIEYKVPPATAPGQKGTMIVLIGIREKEEVASK